KLQVGMDLLQLLFVIDVTNHDGAVAQRHVTGQRGGTEGHLDRLLVIGLRAEATLEHGLDFLAVVDALVDGEHAGAEQVQQLRLDFLQRGAQGLVGFLRGDQAITELRHVLREVARACSGLFEFVLYVQNAHGWLFPSAVGFSKASRASSRWSTSGRPASPSSIMTRISSVGCSVASVTSSMSCSYRRISRGRHEMVRP